MSQWKDRSLLVTDSPSEIGLVQTSASTSTTESHSCSSSSGRCTRENCKYLHPPPHLKTQLEINGRNTLATQKMLQNLQNQQLQQVVGMTNLHQLQPSPSSATLLAGSQGIPSGPGSNQIVIPTSSQYTGKDATAAAAAAAAASASTSLYQHASPQIQYNGLQIVPQSPYTIPASGQKDMKAAVRNKP